METKNKNYAPGMPVQAQECAHIWVKYCASGRKYLRCAVCGKLINSKDD